MWLNAPGAGARTAGGDLSGTGRRAADLTWGDGLEDLSLEALLYGARWDSVGDDELALFIPALARAPQSGARERLVARLRECRAARLWHLAAGHATGVPFAMRPHRRPEAANDGLDTVLADQFQTEAALEAALREGEPAHPDWFGPAALVTRRWTSPRWSLPGKSTHRLGGADLHLEILVLRAIGDLLAAAEGLAGGRQGGEEPPGAAGQADLANAVFAAVHTGLNPAYIHPSLALHHQTLMVAAWLGWLHRGRGALMPIYVAECLHDILSLPASGPIFGPVSGADRLIRLYAAQSRGFPALDRISRRVAAGGSPALVKPARRAGRGNADRMLPVILESLSPPGGRQAVTGSAARRSAAA